MLRPAQPMKLRAAMDERIHVWCSGCRSITSLTLVWATADACPRRGQYLTHEDHGELAARAQRHAASITAARRRRKAAAARRWADEAADRGEYAYAVVLLDMSSISEPAPDRYISKRADWLNASEPPRPSSGGEVASRFGSGAGPESKSSGPQAVAQHDSLQAPGSRGSSRVACERLARWLSRPQAGTRSASRQDRTGPPRRRVVSRRVIRCVHGPKRGAPAGSCVADRVLVHGEH